MLRLVLAVDVRHALEPLEPPLLSLEAFPFALLAEDGLEVLHPPIDVFDIIRVLERARTVEVG